MTDTVLVDVRVLYNVNRSGSEYTAEYVFKDVLGYSVTADGHLVILAKDKRQIACYAVGKWMAAVIDDEEGKPTEGGQDGDEVSP
jgi:hypothetical protein